MLFENSVWIQPPDGEGWASPNDFPQLIKTENLLDPLLSTSSSSLSYYTQGYFAAVIFWEIVWFH